jgi:hypothetical protein
MTRLTILIPELAPTAQLPHFAQALARLEPPADEIIAVVASDADATAAWAQRTGWRIVHAPHAAADLVATGVRAATSPLVCVVPANGVPRGDLVSVAEASLASEAVALVSVLMPGGDEPQAGRRGALRAWLADWLVPLLFRLRLFAPGLRLMRGGHVLAFRRADFLAVGGCAGVGALDRDAYLYRRMTWRGRVLAIGGGALPGAGRVPERSTTIAIMDGAARPATRAPGRTLHMPTSGRLETQIASAAGQA